MANKRTVTPTRPEDARAQRSVEALHAAFLELLQHKRFEEIAIRDITDTAGLSYPTFFRRFASKEALLEDIAAEEVRRVLYLSGQGIDPSGKLRSGAAMCRSIAANRKLWRALLAGGAASAMRREFARVSNEIAQSQPRKNPWLPLDLATAYTTSGIFEILSWWMQQPDDYPIGNVVKIFDALIVMPLGQPRKIKLAAVSQNPPAKGKIRPRPRLVESADD